MKDPNIKFIYLLGNDKIGFHSHTHDKEIAKKFAKQRDGVYKIKKVKYTKKLYETLSCNTELVTHDGENYMSAIEEEYYFDSFAQWESDILHYIKYFLKYDKYIKYTKSEKKRMKELHNFLKHYIKYRNDVYDNGYDIETPLYNTEVTTKWYIDHICKGFQ